MDELRWRRGLGAAVALLLVAAGLGVATIDSGRPTNVAAAPKPATTTTSTALETTTTEAPTTTVAAPAVPLTTRVTRPAAPRTATTRRPTPAPVPGPARQPSGITAAFYYGWYPSAFETQGSRFHESTGGTYNSSDPAVVARQIDQMRYGGMQAAIASWWGPDHMTDKAFAVDLQVAHGTPFKWTIYYELEGELYPNPSVEQIRANLQYIHDRYAGDPNYLHVDGRPVIFVWPDGNDRCEMLDRWNAANAPFGFYLVQKVFPGFTACVNRADSWHHYSPDHYRIEAKGYSFSVGPGFWKYNESPRLARDPAQFESAVAAMAASSAPWKLLTTFNEWNEGTAVEPAQEWASASGYGLYLDILHNHLGSR